MPDLTYFKQLILDHISHLTKNQKKIAQFLLDHPEDIAFSSIDMIADKLSVGKATIVRLAQTLGYSSFLELKTELSNKLRNDLNPTKKFRDAIDNLPHKTDFLTIVITNEIKNIQNTLQLLDRDAFDKAIKILLNAPKIYTMGLGISSLLSQLAAYFLNRITMKATAFTHGSISFHEQIVSLKPGDCIIRFSLLPYSIATIESAENAKSKGIKIISITDELIVPVAQYSDIDFTARTHNIVFISTVSAVLVIICALAIGVGIRDRAKSLQILSLFEKAKTEYGFDVRTDFFK
ncbi:MAG: MurR/RpiR family transcriptional regulator [bacterium]|nr:MAG: MurR/RpiR family transcriptional regulator [bacterium]